MKDYYLLVVLNSKEIKILDENSRRHETNTRTDMRYALSGKIKCYHDGASFIKGNWKSKVTGKERKYWGCSNYRKYGKEKTKGCRTPVIHYNEMVEIFKCVINNILANENGIIKDIYNLINETRSKSDYSKEISDLDNKIADIKNARSELVNMRARKEIDGDEYLESREKYNKDLLLLENKKQSYLEMSKEIDYKSNINDFIKKLHEVILTDDESIFRIFGSIIDTILVERLDETDNENSENHKIMLHFKLNIIGYNKGSLNLKEFLLLFSNTQGCDSDQKAVLCYKRQNANFYNERTYYLEYYYNLYL